MEIFITDTGASWLKAQKEIIDFIDASNGSVKLQVTESKGTGKWGMTRLWMSWMGITAKFMSDNGATMPLVISASGENYGVRPFRKSDAHEAFTAKHLGVDEQGRRLSWSRTEGENVADKGQRFMAMLKHQEWCLERGIMLPKPRESEFYELEEKQND